MPTILYMESPLGPSVLEKDGEAWAGQIAVSVRIPEPEHPRYFVVQHEP